MFNIPIGYDIKEEVKAKRYELSIQERSAQNRMGRFGGGWDFKLGFQSGGSSIIANLGHMYVRIEPAKDKVTTIARTFKFPDRTLLIEMKFPANVDLAKLLSEKVCTIERKKCEVTMRIRGVGRVVLIQP